MDVLVTTSTDLAERADAIFKEAIVWDGVWPLEPWCGNDFDKLKDFSSAGITGVSLTLAGDNHNIDEAFRRLAAARCRILAEPENYILVESIEDVRRAKASGRLAVGFQFEGTRCFERNLHVIEAFCKLGVRQTLLAFNQANCVGGGCAEDRDAGLTRFGVRLVNELQRVGMLVDLSHTGPRTSLDALSIATKPCVFSHSNASALHPHFRNITDEQAMACAASGGLVGISSSSEYLGDSNPTAESLFRHVDYFVQKLGPAHVGLGLDVVFDAAAITSYVRARPDEWPMVQESGWTGFRYGSPGNIRELVELMVAAGYAAADVQGILGGNWMRVCESAWT